MTRTDNDTWDLASSVGATATMVAASRALAAQGPDPLIDDPFAAPLVRAVGITFFTDDGVVGKLLQKQFCDERLRPDIKLQLEIVSFFNVDFERSAEVFANQGAGCARRFNRHVEVLIHT